MLRDALMLALLACTLGTMVHAAQSSRKALLYVAPDGSDSNAGTQEAPFATLGRARDEIRRLKREAEIAPGGATVWVRGGIYFLAESFALTEEDSGAPQAPIMYEGYPGEEVRLTGGRTVTGFQPVTDAEVLERLDPSARGEVHQADLRAQGVTDFGQMQHRTYRHGPKPAPLELFFNGEPMTLARWPNEGWATIVDVTDQAPDAHQVFTYEGDRPSRWVNAPDVWLNGYWANTYAQTYQQMAHIDPQARTIAVKRPDPFSGENTLKPKRVWHAANLLEELDQPGEWYLDRETGVLYFWAPSPLGEGEAVVTITQQPLISLQDVSHLVLQGLTIENTRDLALRVSGGEGVVVADCTIRNIGSWAALIDGRDHQVTRCHLYHLGEGGISFAGGDRRTLTPGGLAVTDSHIHHYQRWVTNCRPAIYVRGVGNLVAHNHIHHAPGSAIFASGNDHIIEFNDVHDMVQEIHDGGAFYMGYDWTQRGHIIRYNYWHDLGTPDTNPQAVYLDDFTSGVTVFGNVCYRAKRGVLVGGGRDNLVANNILVDCTPAVHVDARGMTWAKGSFDGTDGPLFTRLAAMPYREPPWSERYPELLGYPGETPAVPTGNRIVRNVYSGGRWLDLIHGLTTEIVAVENNWTEGDPGFVDPENEVFQLRDDSPVWERLGFERIPMEEIGPRTPGE